MQSGDYNTALTIIMVSVLILILLVFTLMIAFRYRKKRESHLLEKQRMRFDFEQAQLASQLEIQEQSFRMISQEIHDNIGQVLSLAKLQLNTMNLDERLQAEEKLNTARDLLTRSIADLRDLSKTLHPDWVRDQGLIRAVETELALLRRSGMQVEIMQDEMLPAIDQGRQLVVYRVVQEVLQNIIKHAAANTIKVTFSCSGDFLRLDIEDDGKGFELSADSDGSGLHNIRQRMEVIGGTLQITSAINNGTCVTLQVPVKETA